MFSRISAFVRNRCTSVSMRVGGIVENYIAASFVVCGYSIYDDINHTNTINQVIISNGISNGIMWPRYVINKIKSS